MPSSRFRFLHIAVLIPFLPLGCGSDAADDKSASVGTKASALKDTFFQYRKTGLCLSVRSVNAGPTEAFGFPTFENCVGDNSQNWELAPDGSVKHGNMCLRGDPSNTGSTQIQTEKCNGLIDQQWQLNGDKLVWSRNDQLCLGGRAVQNAPAELEPCNSVGTFDIAVPMQIEHPATDGCLDMQSAIWGTKDGPILNACDRQEGQRFQWMEASKQIGFLTKCLAADSEGRISLEDCNAASANQAWEMLPTGRIRHSFIGRCLEVPESPAEPVTPPTRFGTPVKLAPCKSNDSQIWVMKRAGNAQRWQDATCDITTLSPSTSAGDNQRCSGPWRYKGYNICYKEKRSQACGVQSPPKECHLPQSCIHNDDVHLVPDIDPVELKQVWRRSPRPTSTSMTVSRKFSCRNQEDCLKMCRPGAEALPHGLDRTFGRDNWIDVQARLDTATKFVGRVPGVSMAEGLVLQQFPTMQPPFNRTKGVNFRPTWLAPGELRCTVDATNIPNVTYGRGKSCKPENGIAQCVNNDYPQYKSCRLPEHGEETDQSKCRYTFHYYSDFGLTRDEFRQSTTRPETGLLSGIVDASGSDNPVCTTYDHMPVKTSADVQAKFDALSGENDFTLWYSPEALYPMRGDTPASRPWRVALMKMLFELRGDELTPAQQGKAIDLYKSQPLVASTCGAHPWTLPVTYDRLTGLADIDKTLAMCARMALPHVRPAVTDIVMDQCLGAIHGTVFGFWEEYQDSRPYWNFMYNDAPALLRKWLERPVDADLSEEDAVKEYTARLKAIQMWYGSANAFSYSGELQHIAESITGAFWQGVYGNSLTRLSGKHAAATNESGVDLVRALNESIENNFEQNRRVMLAAFPANGAAPLTSTPLLYVLADVLTPMADRMSDLGLVHDIACRVRECGIEKSESQLSQVWNLLASIMDSSTLRSNLEYHSSKLGGANGWHKVFVRLKDNHALLLSALADAFGPEATENDVDIARVVTHGTASELPTPTLRLAQLVRKAIKRAERYNTLGTFEADSPTVLRSGMANSDYVTARGKYDSSRATFDQAVTTFNNGIRERIKEALELQQVRAQKDQIELKSEASLKRYDTLSSQLLSLRTNEKAGNDSFSDFMKSFEAALASKAFNGNALVATGEPIITSLSGANAGYIPGRTNLFESIAVNWGADKPSLSGTPGTVFSISVSGEWSPTCALQRSRLPDGNFISPPDARLITWGPEGFSFVLQNDEYKAHAISDASSSDTYVDVSTSSRACVGAKVETASPGVGVKVSAYASLDTCIQSSVGERINWAHSGTETSTTSGRVSASFNVGARLKDTPYANLPAGSLLVVESPEDRATEDNIHVLRRGENAIVLTRKSRLHLVVNDSADCQNSATPRLTISTTTLVPAASIAESLGSVMQRVMQNVREKSKAFETQGRISASELSVIRSEAYMDLAHESGRPNAEIPTYLQSFFDAWLNKELASLERRIAIAGIELELSQLELDSKIFRKEIQSTIDKSHMLQMLSAWSVMNLEGERLRIALQDVGTMLAQYLYPMWRIRYAEQLNSIQKDSLVVQYATDLLNAPWSASLAAQANTLSSLLQRLTSLFEQAELSGPSSYQRTVPVIISFPNPKYTLGDEETPSVWAKVDAGRANQVWTNINAGRNADFTIYPEDLYAKTGGKSVLTCSQQAPVIRSMALYVARPNASTGSDLINATKPSVPVVAASTTLWPTSEGVQQTRLADKARSESVRLIYGTTDQAWDVFAKEIAGESGGKGVAPFTTFTVTTPEIHKSLGDEPWTNPSSANDDPQKISEILVMMHLETGTTDKGLPAVRTCN